MSEHDFKIPMDQFSEYAMLLEDDDYPKTDFTQLQFRGKIDHAAMAEAYEEAVSQVPIFSANVIHDRVGAYNIPFWVPNRELKNRMIFEDCRHWAEKPFDPMEFSTKFHAARTRKRIDLARQFPFNVYLIRVEDDRYIFSVLYHHSCLDPAKFYVVMTKMLSGYHERVKGKPPEWATADGMAGLARDGKVISPYPIGKYAIEQFADIWYHHPTSKVSHAFSREIRDYKKCQGRHSVRSVIDDPKLIKGMFSRSKRSQATINDLLLACARKGLGKWNKEHDAAHERFRMMLISSLKGRKDNRVVESGAAVAAINMVSKDHTDADLDDLIKMYRDFRVDRLTKGYDLQFNYLINRFINAFRVLPFHVRKPLLISIIQGTPMSFYLSNVGVVWPKFVDGKPTMESRIPGAGDFVIDDIHSSASIAKDIGVGMTTRTHNGKFYMNFVMDRFRFHKDEALGIRDAIVDEVINASS
jgi:hypothetical protein